MKEVFVFLYRSRKKVDCSLLVLFEFLFIAQMAVKDLVPSQVDMRQSSIFTESFDYLVHQFRYKPIPTDIKAIEVPVLINHFA
jgi:hypothetical protein